MFTLYCHITPSNKYYFGITSETVHSRWGEYGEGYRTQIFYKAIQKYGWDNIKHIIICENLSKEWACKLEQDFIRIYKSNNKKYGYNLTLGGDGSWGREYHASKETIKKIQKSREWYKHHSNETKQKISRANKGKHLGKHISPNTEFKPGHIPWSYGKKLSKEHKKKLSMAHTGYIMPDEQKEKIRRGNLGKIQSSETREKISRIVKERHKYEKEHGIKRNHSNNTSWVRGTKWYNNGIKNVRCVDCPIGYKPGRIKRRQFNDKTDVF